MIFTLVTSEKKEGGLCFLVFLCLCTTPVSFRLAVVIVTTITNNLLPLYVDRIKSNSIPLGVTWRMWIVRVDCFGFVCLLLSFFLGGWGQASGAHIHCFHLLPENSFFHLVVTITTDWALTSND